MNRASNFLNPGWSIILTFLIFISTLQAQQPYVRGSSPRNGTENFIRNAFISARIELPVKKVGVDEKSVDTSSVRLYPTNQPQQLVEAYITINSYLKNITLEPKALLEPNTSYTFEVTDKLKDQEGNAFQPYSATFITNEISLTKHITTDRPEALVIGPKVAAPVPTRPIYVAQAEAKAAPQAPIKTPLIPSRRIEEADNHEMPKDTTSQASPQLARTEVTVKPEKKEISNIESLSPAISFRTDIVSMNGKIPVGFSFPKNEDVKYIIKDKAGKIVKRGSGKISAGIQTKLISVKDLQVGRYQIAVRVGDLLESHIFTIQK